MLSVLTGYSIILVVIFVGWLLAQRKVIRSDAERLMFNRVAFYAATPSLLFTAMSQADPQTLFTPVTVITTLAAVVVAVLFCIPFWKRGRAFMAAGAGSSAVFNSVNIGLPVSIYVIGDATYVIPIVMVQMVLITPFLLAGLSGQSLLKSMLNGLSSPVVVAPLLGIAVALGGWTVPAPIAEPLSILGGASIPMILMSFGASLSTSGILSERDLRPAILWATALKLFVMPAAGFLMAWSAGLSTDLIYACTILCALPTAQNVYNYAATYGRGQTIARDTVFITTFASLPVMLLIAFLFGR